METSQALKNLELVDLSHSVKKEMVYLKDIDMKNLLFYMENKKYKDLLNLGIEMLKNLKIISSEIIADYSMILYLVSLASINLNNNEMAIFFLE